MWWVGYGLGLVGMVLVVGGAASWLPYWGEYDARSSTHRKRAREAVTTGGLGLVLVLAGLLLIVRSW